MGDGYGEKKGLKKRLTDWYNNSNDGYFADYCDGAVGGMDWPMYFGERIARGIKGKGLDSYEPLSNGLKRRKAHNKRSAEKGDWIKREAVYVAGWLTGGIGSSIAGVASLGGAWYGGYAAEAGNAMISGIRALKRKIKKERV